MSMLYYINANTYSVATATLHISWVKLCTTCRFPLFAKGSEKALFQYAVYLLNKDIAQARPFSTITNNYYDIIGLQNQMHRFL